MGQFERVANVNTHVWSLSCLFKEAIKEEELTIILLITDVRVDGHTIIEVKRKRKNGVVDDAHVLSIAIQDDI